MDLKHNYDFTFLLFPQNSHQTEVDLKLLLTAMGATDFRYSHQTEVDLKRQVVGPVRQS